MTNGMETSIVPDTIKDWIAGKVLRALPKRLTQKLLSFLVDNRDFEGTMGYRENPNGDIPEFTVLMYRTAKSKIRKEEEAQKLARKRGSMLNHPEFHADELEDLKSKMFGTSEDQKNTKTIFESDTGQDSGIGGSGLKPEGSKFFSEEMVVDQSQVIPLANTNRFHIPTPCSSSTTLKLNKSGDTTGCPFTAERVRKRQKLEEAEDKAIWKLENNDFSDSDNNSENDSEINSDDVYSTDRAPKLFDVVYPTIIPVRSNPEKPYKCTFCKKYFNSLEAVQRHIRRQHVDDYNRLPRQQRAHGVVVRKRLRHDCHLCEASYTRKEKLLNHYKKVHPDTWNDDEKREQIKQPRTSSLRVEALQRISEYPEIIIDQENKSYTCTQCSRSMKTAASIINHVDSVHRNVKRASCKICGQDFASVYGLKRHMFTHTGDYPNKCTYCDRAFRSSHRVREHKRKYHQHEFNQELLIGQQQSNEVDEELARYNVGMPNL